jgi:hypothetical protein
MADIENYLRNKGQALQQGMKQKIKAGFDDPVQQKLAAIAEAKAKPRPFLLKYSPILLPCLYKIRIVA